MRLALNAIFVCHKQPSEFEKVKTVASLYRSVHYIFILYSPCMCMIRDNQSVLHTKNIHVVHCTLCMVSLTNLIPYIITVCVRDSGSREIKRQRHRQRSSLIILTRNSRYIGRLVAEEGKVGIDLALNPFLTVPV